jgi:hypothetical protein
MQGWLVGLLFELGEWDDALAAEAILQGIGGPNPEAFWLVPLFLRRGERAEAEARMELLLRTLDPTDVQARTAACGLGAVLALAEGRAAQALAGAQEALEGRAELSLGHGAVKNAYCAAVEAAFALGDGTRVDELLGMLETVPPGELTPFYRAMGARFGARRAALRGDLDTAGAGFAAAAEIFRETERPFELAIVQLEHAESLAANGRLDETEPLLDAARTTFVRLRAEPWLDRLAAVTAARPALVD